jgi:hypothetical protein
VISRDRVGEACVTVRDAGAVEERAGAVEDETSTVVGRRIDALGYIELVRKNP